MKTRPIYDHYRCHASANGVSNPDAIRNFCHIGLDLLTHYAHGGLWRARWLLDNDARRAVLGYSGSPPRMAGRTGSRRRCGPAASR